MGRLPGRVVKETHVECVESQDRLDGEGALLLCAAEVLTSSIIAFLVTADTATQQYAAAEDAKEGQTKFCHLLHATRCEPSSAVNSSEHAS